MVLIRWLKINGYPVYLSLYSARIVLSLSIYAYKY
jgi:hypothetical protein